MRLIGCMSWFDEPETFLTRAVTTAARSGVQHLVAVDGAYALLPGAAAASPPKQAKAIMAAARQAGIGLTLCAPRDPWPTEMAKRETMFRHALAEAVHGVDWFFVLDADYECRADAPALYERLSSTDMDAATILAYTPPGPNGEVTMGPPERLGLPALFRAQRITLGVNHFTYIGERGERLWGNKSHAPVVDALDCADVFQVTHWTYHRPRARNARQYEYYRARDRSTVERGRCLHCGGQATIVVPQFERRADESVAAMLVEVCDECYGAHIRTQRARAIEWGLADMELNAIEQA